MAGIAICTSQSKLCKDIRVSKNIVAGVPYAGFIVMAHQCSDYSQENFHDNIAHSIGDQENDSQTGIGAIIYPDPQQASNDCFEASNFVAYKTKM